MELLASEIKALQNGNNLFFERLIDCYQDRVYALCFKITRNEEDAKEVAQVAFIKCYQNIKSYAFKAKFSVWLYSITHNECLSFLKKKKRWDYDYFEKEYHEPEHLPEVEKRYTENERKETVTTLMRFLTPQEQLLLNLYYLEELSYKEIVAVTKLSLANVKVKMHRAKNKLKSKAALTALKI